MSGGKAVTETAAAGRRVFVPLGCARLAPAEPHTEATVNVTYQDILKLARVLLDGCAQRKEEIAVVFAGQGSLIVKPDYMLRPHKAVQELGGLSQFYTAAWSLASSFGAKPGTESELARWGYAEWRIPPSAVPKAPADRLAHFASVSATGVPASDFLSRLDRLCQRASEDSQRKGTRRRRGHCAQMIGGSPRLGATPPCGLCYDGSVFYVFSAAIRLLNIVGAHTEVPQTVTLVPSAGVGGDGPLELHCSGAHKRSKHVARCIVRDIMHAGLDLFRLRTRHLLFEDASRAATADRRTVAQQGWGWEALPEDLHVRWAYAAFRIRYLTRL